MWKLAWDFFLSLTFRAVFAFALVGGVSFLEWTYHSWRTGFWQDEPHFAQLSFLLAGIATLVGLIGTFRRGRAEARFSMVSLMAVAIEAMGSVCLPKTGLYLPETHIGERTLHRFPSVESFLLGGFLIILWLVAPFWQEETWILRNAAIIGGAQIIWGFGIECLGVEGGGAASTGEPTASQERPGPPLDPRHSVFDAMLHDPDGKLVAAEWSCSLPILAVGVWRTVTGRMPFCINPRSMDRRGRTPCSRIAGRC